MQLTLAILIVLTPSVISLQCYVCNSNVDESCAGGSDLNKFIRTCNETIEPYCRKIDQTVNKISSIVRVCGSKTGSKPCYKTAGINNAKVCSCNDNVCNNAINFKRQERILTLISSFAVLAITILILR